MKILRRILFYLFILLYIIICPYVILNALGIVYHPIQDRMTKTGLVHISTLPSGARIYVNRTPFSDKTPATIRSLMPGTYDIAVFLHGYYPWQKQLTVEGEKATSAANILLIPKNWNRTTIAPMTFNLIYPVVSLNAFMLIDHLTLNKISLYTWPNDIRADILQKNKFLMQENIKNISSSGTLEIKNKILKIFSQPNSSLAVFQVAVEGQIKYFSCDLLSAEPAQKDITKLFLFAPENISWDANNPQRIFIKHKDLLDMIDLKAEAVYPKIVREVELFDIYDNHLYVLHNNNTFIKYNIKGEKISDLLENQQLKQKLFVDHAVIKLDVLSSDIIIFITKQGGLLSNHLPNLFVEEGVRGYEFNKNRNQLLIWKKDDIGVLTFKRSHDDALFEQGPKLEWLTIDADNILQATLINKGHQIVYRDQNAAYITGRNTFQQPTSYKITDLKRNSSYSYAHSLGGLFFLDKDNLLSFIEIIPTKNLLDIVEFENEPPLPPTKPTSENN